MFSEKYVVLPDLLANAIQNIRIGSEAQCSGVNVGTGSCAWIAFEKGMKWLERGGVVDLRAYGRGGEHQQRKTAGAALLGMPRSVFEGLWEARVRDVYEELPRGLALGTSGGDSPERALQDARTALGAIGQLGREHGLVNAEQLARLEAILGQDVEATSGDVLIEGVEESVEFGNYTGALAAQLDFLRRTYSMPTHKADLMRAVRVRLCLSRTALNQGRRGGTDGAIAWANSALEGLEAQRETERRVDALLLLGIAARQDGLFAECSDAVSAAFDLARGHERIMRRVHGQVALNKAIQGEFLHAIDLTARIVAEEEEDLGDPLRIANDRMKYGLVLSLAGLDSGEEELLRAYRDQDMGYFMSRSIGARYLALHYLHRGRFDRVLQWAGELEVVSRARGLNRHLQEAQRLGRKAEVLLHHQRRGG